MVNVLNILLGTSKLAGHAVINFLRIPLVPVLVGKKDVHVIISSILGLSGHGTGKFI
jgi:hypothetical protein